MGDLISDLSAARRLAVDGLPCAACEHLATLAAGPERDALRDALAGTIGVNKLAAILRAHDIPVGRRSIERHRKEGHS